MTLPICAPATLPPMRSDTACRPITSRRPERHCSPVAAFTIHDDQHAPRVAVVNQTFARKVFGTPDRALGHFFKLPDGARIEVVGVAEDGKYTANLAEDPQPAMFFPTAYRCRRARHGSSSARRPTPSSCRRRFAPTLRALDPGLPAYIETWTRDMDGALFAPRVAAAALGILGAMGAIVAITGIFGTAAYSLSKRLKELGIRMALGAGISRSSRRRSAALFACSRWARSRAWSSGSSRAACSPRLCMRPHRVIRWC